MQHFFISLYSNIKLLCLLKFTFDHLVCSQHNVSRTGVRHFWEGVLQPRVSHPSSLCHCLSQPLCSRYWLLCQLESWSEMHARHILNPDCTRSVWARNKPSLAWMIQQAGHCSLLLLESNSTHRENVFNSPLHVQRCLGRCVSESSLVYRYQLNLPVLPL